MSIKALVNPDEISLENIVENLSPDPPPGVHKASKRKTRSSSSSNRGAPSRSRAAVQRELASAIADQVAFASVLIQLRDPVCAPVLAEQADAIGQAAAKLAVRWPWLAQMVTSGALFADVVGLVQAVLPVVMVARAHHSARPDEGGMDGTGPTAYADYAPYTGPTAP